MESCQHTELPRGVLFLLRPHPVLQAERQRRMQAQVCVASWSLRSLPVTCSRAGVSWVCRKTWAPLQTTYRCEPFLRPQAPNWGSSAASEGRLRLHLARGVLPKTLASFHSLTSISSFPETPGSAPPQALESPVPPPSILDVPVTSPGASWQSCLISPRSALDSNPGRSIYCSG